MRFRILLLMTLVSLIVSTSVAFAIPDPLQPDSVKFDSVAVNRDDTTVVMRLVFKYDETKVGAAVVPLRWNSSDVTIDTTFNSWPDPDDPMNYPYYYGVDFTKGCARMVAVAGLTRNFSTIPVQRAQAFAQAFTGYLLGGTYVDTLFCDIWFKILPGAAPQVVTIDTGFFPPANTLMFVNGQTFEDWVPVFKTGKITIKGGGSQNAPPVITCPGAKTTDIGALLSFNVTATDDGQPAPPALVLTAQNVPAWASFTDQGNGTGTFTGTPGCANVGQTTVTFIANDGEAADTCTVSVTVNPDNIPPVVTCPADINVNNNAGQCGAIVNYSASATDNCGTPTVVLTPPSGTLFPVGTTLVTAIATDGAGKKDTCTFNVTVNDTENPVVTCPADINVNNDPSQCGALVNFTVTATDNCGAPTIVATPPSGSFFPIGTTLVTAIATDGAGKKDTCTFNVTVTDAEDPVVTCPSNITTNVDPGQCYATVVFTATATDNCPGVTVVAVPPSGSQFNEGTTTQVTVTATDAHGRTSQCTFDVTVNPVTDQFAANPTTLTFNYLIGNPAPTNKTVDISNLGCGPIAFNATIGPPGNGWLSVDPTVGPTPKTLTASVDITGLGVGTYNGYIEIDGGGLQTLQIPVTLYVTGAENLPPQFVVCPSPQQVTEDNMLTFAVGAIDPNEGDEVTYSAENVPAGAAILDSILAWTPYCYQAAQYMVRFIASDGELADTCEIVINVLDDPIQLNADPVSLTFNYKIGDPVPGDQIVIVDKTGCGPVDVGASVTQPWLSVDPLFGNAPATFTVSVDITGLAEGVYNDIITFSFVPPPRTLSPVPSVQVPVTLNVTTEACDAWAKVGDVSGEIGTTVDVPVNFKNCVNLAGISLPLRWNPDAVTLDSIDYTGSRVDYITTKSDGGNINNTNNTVMLYALVISEGPIAAGEGLFATLKFHIDDCSLTPIVIDTAFIAPTGYYMFADMGGNPVPTAFDAGSISVLPGDLNVVLTPDNMTFEGTIGDPNPDCQQLSVTTDWCSGLSFAVWNVLHKPAWATVDPSSGQFPGSPQVCVDMAGLPAGTYIDSIVVAASELPAAVVPATAIPITLIIHGQPPMIVLDQGVFMLETMDCGPDTVATATLNITNGGGGALNWSAEWNEPWLDLSPSGGTAPSSVTITVVGGGMPPAVYADTVKITASGASNSPQYVIVHMTVTACPQGDTVWVGSGSGGLGDDVVIPVTFANSQELSGLSIPLKYSHGIVQAVSGDFTGSRVDYLGQKIVTINEAERTICIAAIPLAEPLIPAGKGLLVNLHFTVLSTDSCPAQVVVEIDSNYVPPGCEFMFTDAQTNAVYPEFFPGQIAIECPGGISGIVRDDADNPIPGCVEAWTSYPDGQKVGEDCAGEDGEFNITGLDDGCYDLRAVLEGYCTVVLEDVCSPSQGVVIVMDSIPDPVVTPFVADYWGTSVMFAGYLVQPGDVITAWDPQGVLCGVAYVENPGYYLIHVYGDDTLSTPGVDEGAREGDVITFEVNCQSNCQLAAEHLWTNHASFHEELVFECVCEQLIELCDGWSLISYRVPVVDQSIGSVLAPIYGDLKQVISSTCEDGAVTWDKNRPEELNDLHEMDNFHGYWVYAPGPVALNISGPPCLPANTPIELCEQWNLISYLPIEADVLNHALGSIYSDLLYAFGFDCTYGAQTFDPQRPEILNDLKCLEPGRGYWVKLDEAGTLVYPVLEYQCYENDGPLPKVLNLTGTVKPTPWACDFWSYGSASGPAKGSVLSVRDEQGTICGQAVVLDGGMFLVHVYGDDPNTMADEGANAGSRLVFESDGVQYEVAGSDTWTERASNLITLSRSGGNAAVPSAYELFQNYPNPFNPNTTLRFKMPDNMHVTLAIYNVLGQKVRTLVDEVLPAGEHQVEWNGTYDDGRRAESGVYFYRLSTAVFTDVRKMTLVK